MPAAAILAGRTCSKSCTAAFRNIGQAGLVPGALSIFFKHYTGKLISVAGKNEGL
jgi:hypothetical protein